MHFGGLSQANESKMFDQRQTGLSFQVEPAITTKVPVRANLEHCQLAKMHQFPFQRPSIKHMPPL